MLARLFDQWPFSFKEVAGLVGVALVSIGPTLQWLVIGLLFNEPAGSSVRRIGVGADNYRYVKLVLIVHTSECQK